ncbi:hypothetical protein L596_002849 [Steinernema carpocapsae]|uniref:Inositol-pentakisphosphate 2-kinase n=1 Tax=Steinernema carpocapsae TaxID=34508 RepID=A0A4U8USA3_STECR|nr:hypothetical protein L596_002849 [Steinernema carpocapsae]
MVFYVDLDSEAPWNNFSALVGCVESRLEDNVVDVERKRSEELLTRLANGRLGRTRRERGRQCKYSFEKSELHGGDQAETRILPNPQRNGGSLLPKLCLTGKLFTLNFMEKTHARAFDTMYEFCPLNFFSGNLEKLRSSLFALLRDPHRNLRIFQGPSLVYSNNDHLAIADLERLLFPKQDITISTFVEAVRTFLEVSTNNTNLQICYALAGVSRVGEPFRVSKQSVLESLLRIQKLDTIGIVQAYKIFSQLPDNVKEDLDNNLFDAAQGLSFLEGKDALSLLQQYLLAATVKDCSLMMNITPLAHDEEFKDATASEVAIAQNGADIRFAVSVKIVDLDPKLTKHILSCYKRFAKGVELIKANPGIHKRCVFHPVL